MDAKLTNRELDALRKVASLGSMYHVLHSEACSLKACGLIELSGDGCACLTDAGRQFLRVLDASSVQGGFT